jgi:ATP-dependent RNA helicase DDX24/MAK5
LNCTYSSVSSHPQAVAQCEEFLNVLDVSIRAEYDTAGAAKRIADAALAKERARSEDSFMRNTAEELGVEYDSEDEGNLGGGWKGGRGGGRKRKEKQASEMSKAELGAMKAKLREELGKRVNLGVSEKYITGGRVDVAALLREREQGGGTTGLFLGGEGLGMSLGFE